MQFSRYDSMVEAVRRDIISRGHRMDANELAAMARELESIEAKVTHVIYPELKALQFAPLIGGVDPGADTWTWRLRDIAGRATLLSTGPNTPPEKVTLQLGEFYRPLRSYGASYGYSVQQLRGFALAKSRGSSISLDTDLAEASRLVIARQADTVIALGEANVTNMTGLLNDPNVPEVSAPTGSWSSASPGAILADMFYSERTVFTNSKGVLTPTHMGLPQSQFGIVSTTPIGADVNKTILTFFLANSMFVKTVEHWYQLSGAGNSSTDRCLCYRRDPLVGNSLQPIIYEAQAPQLLGWTWDIPCETRVGAALFRQPLGALYMDGI